jgi:hypothetical protein
MEKSPVGEADSFSVSKEITRLLWNLKVNYQTHTYPKPWLSGLPMTQSNQQLTPQTTND